MVYVAENTIELSFNQVIFNCCCAQTSESRNKDRESSLYHNFYSSRILLRTKSSFALVSYTSSVAQFYLSNPHCCAARVETAKSTVSSQVCAKQKSLSIIFSKYLFCKIYLQLLTVNMRKSSITTCIFRKVYRSGT